MTHYTLFPEGEERLRISGLWDRIQDGDKRYGHVDIDDVGVYFQGMVEDGFFDHSFIIAAPFLD